MQLLRDNALICGHIYMDIAIADSYCLENFTASPCLVISCLVCLASPRLLKSLCCLGSAVPRNNVSTASLNGTDDDSQNNALMPKLRNIVMLFNVTVAYGA